MKKKRIIERLVNLPQRFYDFVFVITLSMGFDFFVYIMTNKLPLFLCLIYGFAVGFFGLAAYSILRIGHEVGELNSDAMRKQEHDFKIIKYDYIMKRIRKEGIDNILIKIFWYALIGNISGLILIIIAKIIG